MKRTLAFLAILALAATWPPQFSEDVTAGSSSISEAHSFRAGDLVQVAVAGTAANNARVRFSPDYLKAGNFEMDRVIDPETGFVPDSETLGFDPAWNNDDGTGTLINPWSTVTGGPVLTLTQKSLYQGDTVLTDRYTLAFVPTGGSQIVANPDAELVVGNDFTNWTENVHAGSGTIVDEATNKNSGVHSMKFTGGNAALDSTSDNITVVASTNYTLQVWLKLGATGDIPNVRVQEVTGGSKYLKNDNTWTAGVQNACAGWVDSTTAQYCRLNFTTESGITALKIILAVDVSGDIVYFDDITLQKQDTNTTVAQDAIQTLNDPTANAYELCFSYSEGLTAQMQYAVVDRAAGGIDAPATQWWTGSAFSGTETWLLVTESATKATTCQVFTVGTTARKIQVRFRMATSGEDKTGYLDDVRLTQAATATDTAVTLTPIIFQVPTNGKFAVRADNSTVVNFARLK